MKLTQGQLDSISQIINYLENSHRFFVYRDEMRSRIHLSNIIYSPITLEAAVVKNIFKTLVDQINA